MIHLPSIRFASFSLCRPASNLSFIALIIAMALSGSQVGAQEITPHIHEVARLTGHGGTRSAPAGIRAISLSRDGRFVAYTPHWRGASGHSPILWDLLSATRISQPVERQSQGSLHIAISPDGRRIVSEGLHQIHFWNTNAPTSPTKLIGTRGGVGIHMTGCSFSSDGSLIATSHPGQKLFVWNAETGESAHSFDGAGGLAVFSPDDSHVAAAAEELTIRIWNLARRGFPKQLRFSPDVPRQMEVRLNRGGKRRVSSEVAALRYSSSGKQLSAVGGVRGIPFHWTTWNCDTGMVASTQVIGRRPTAAAIVPNGDFILLGDADGSIGLWDARTGKEFFSTSVHSGSVDSIAISDDGRTIVSGGIDLKVVVLKLNTHKNPAVTSVSNER